MRAESTLRARGWPRLAARCRPAAMSARRTLAAAPRLCASASSGRLLGLGGRGCGCRRDPVPAPRHLRPVGDMLGAARSSCRAAAWSDDTAMALCLAESLLERSGFDARDQVAALPALAAGGLPVGDRAVRRDHGRAPRGRWRRAQWRRQPFSGSHDPRSARIRSRSRASRPSVLFFFADAAEAVRHAGEAARTTCQAPAVLDACRSLAPALHAAALGRAARRASWPQERGRCGRALPRPGGEMPARRRRWRQRLRRSPRAAISATRCWHAANLGGNSDVVAAALRGSSPGRTTPASAIPTFWRNSLMNRTLIEGFADRLLAHALVDFSRLTADAGPRGPGAGRHARPRLS